MGGNAEVKDMVMEAIGNVVETVERFFNGIRDFFKTKFAGVSLGEFVTLGMLSSAATAVYTWLLNAIGAAGVLASPIGAAGTIALGAYTGVKITQSIGRNDLVSLTDENRAFLVALIAALVFGAFVVNFPAVPGYSSVAQTVIATVFP